MLGGGAHLARPAKRRIANDVIKLLGGDHLSPRFSQRVAYHDVGIILQWLQLNGVIDDGAGFRHHLAPSDPQGVVGCRDRTFIELQAIELLDRDFDRVEFAET